MQINPQYKVRNVVDENVVMVQGKNAGDMTTVVALNDTSLYLWNSLSGREFELSDVVSLLTDKYDVEHDRATADAESWIDTMRQNNLII